MTNAFSRCTRIAFTGIALLFLCYATHCGGGGGGSSGGGGNGGGGNGGGGTPTTPDTPQSTRFRITNSCQYTIWIQQQNMPAGTPSVVQLNSGTSFDFNIPDAGLASTRFWPKTGCDGSGQNCAIGQSSNPCPAVGCAPPVDSKIEATWGCTLSDTSQCAITPQGNVIPPTTDYNASAVDGFTLPFKVNVQTGGGSNCANLDCSGLNLNQCPTNENLSQGQGGSFPQFASESLQVVTPNSGQTAGCFSPCIKFNYPTYGGLNLPNIQSDPEIMYCCPTPPISSGQCRAGPAASTQYVGLIHSACTGGVYGYAYDDGVGLHQCSAPTQIEMVFGPNCP
ncbi:MAG: hypothetical protein U1F57_10435 [bacterium]